jgi:hypothetical protein
MMMDDYWDEIEPIGEVSEPRWTPRRVLYLAIILLTLVMFLLYTLWPVFFPPAPPLPPLPPRQQV